MITSACRTSSPASPAPPRPASRPPRGARSRPSRARIRPSSARRGTRRCSRPTAPCGLSGLGWDEPRFALFLEQCALHFRTFSDESLHIVFATALLAAVSMARPETLRIDALVAVLFGSSENAVRKVHSRELHRVVSEIEEISQVKLTFLDLVGSLAGRPRVV